MREHPVPQDITGYNFHIIGDMTIKQFAEVGVGVILGFGIYATNLPGLIKWPLIVLSAGLGALAAFVPIEEQPVDHWIVTFIRVLYKPTKYYWRRKAKIPDAFTYKSQNDAQTEISPDLSPAKKEQIKQYLFSLDTPIVDQQTAIEQQKLDWINSAFQTDPNQPMIAPPIADSQNFQVIDYSNLTQSQPVQDDYYYSPTQNAKTQEIPTNTTIQQEQRPQFSIPQTPQIKMGQRQAPLEIESSNQTYAAQINQPQPMTDEPLAQITLEQPETQLQVAQTSTSLPFPTPPTEPNKIAGMVLSQNNDILNDAIVEIKKITGQVVRAVKTNSLGQFFVSTPLKSGEYLIEAEKPGFRFVPQKLILSNEVLAPLEIRGQTT